MTQKMADTPSPLANLSFCAKTHSSPQIRCVHAKRSSPGRPSFPSTRHCGVWPGPENIQIPFDRRQCGQPFQTSWTLDLKRLLRSGALFKKFSNAGRWKGHSVCKWSRGASSWAQSLKRWKNTTQTFDATGWVLTETRRSWKDWTAPLLSGCSDTSMLSKFGCSRAFCLEGLLWSPPWTAKWLAWLAKNLLKPPKERPFIQKPATSYHRPVGVNEKRLSSAAVGAISTNPMSLKAKGKCT